MAIIKFWIESLVIEKQEECIGLKLFKHHAPLAQVSMMLQRFISL